MLDYLRLERGSSTGEYALALAVLASVIALLAIALEASLSNSLKASGELFTRASSRSDPGPTDVAAKGQGRRGGPGGHGSGKDHPKGGTGHDRPRP